MLLLFFFDSSLFLKHQYGVGYTLTLVKVKVFSCFCFLFMNLLNDGFNNLQPFAHSLLQCLLSVCAYCLCCCRYHLSSHSSSSMCEWGNQFTCYSLLVHLIIRIDVVMSVHHFHSDCDHPTTGCCLTNILLVFTIDQIF